MIYFAQDFFLKSTNVKTALVMHPNLIITKAVSFYLLCFTAITIPAIKIPKIPTIRATVPIIQMTKLKNQIVIIKVNNAITNSIHTIIPTISENMINSRPGLGLNGIFHDFAGMK